MNELLTMLESKYKRLEYIQSTGTQYIDTGYKPNNNTRVVTEFYTNVQNVQQFIFGGGRNLANNCFICQIHYTPSQYIRAWYGNSYSQGFDFDINSFHKIDFDKNKFYLDGELKETITQETFQSEYNMAIFSYIQFTGVSSNYFYGKIKYFQIYDNGTLVRNMIPVMRKSDNEIGMLDLVEGKFYPNAGTGKFTANLDTMYAIIQGSPTINNGFVSNISDSNYLTIKNLTQNTSFVFCFQTGDSISSRTQIVSSSALLDISIQSGNLQAWNFQSNTMTTLCPVQTKTYYWVKVEVSTTTKTYYYSTDGKNYSEAITINDNKGTGDNTLFFGRFYNSTGYSFGGVINLNRSSITKGSTKYKLQAVVGYTVVGSPTIVDGVVSGFSANDYLQTSNTTSNENIELYTRFKFISSESGSKPIFGFIDNWYSPFCFVIGNRVSGYAGDTYANLQDNTWYRIKVTYNGTVAKCEVYNDDNTLRASNNREYSTTIQNGIVRIGGTYSILLVVIDSIDLNNTYIKINNKLWFNGLGA